MSVPNPRVSFVLIAYKQERYIREAVQGALAQTYSPLEIILSDDASPDRTFEIIQEMAAAYQGPHQVILNRNERNLGIGAHVQACFELSSGEWIVGAAGDDISEPERVAVLMAAIGNEKNAVAAASAYQRIDEQGNRLATHLPPGLRVNGVRRPGEYDWIAESKKGIGIGISGCSAMWHRSLFSNFPKLTTGIVAEDVILTFRAYLTGSIVLLNHSLMRYRAHSENAYAILIGDAGHEEDRRTHFLMNYRPCLEMNLTDYRHYLATHPLVHEDPAILAWIECNLSMNDINSTWWQHGLLWKIKSVLHIVRLGGVRKAKGYGKRMLTKSQYVSYINFIRGIQLRKRLGIWKTASPS